MPIDVVGVPILERNICSLLSSVFTDLVAVTSVQERAVFDFVETRGRALAAARGARLECAIEPEPLGTIGIVEALVRRADPLLVLAADNLAALDLKKLVDHHRAAGAAMTVATHEQPFPITFGEVEVVGGRIRRYMEKPVRRIPISSGIYVVGASAAALITPGARCDTPELIERLLARNLVVAAFAHGDPWIDINDAAAVRAAARLVRLHGDRFDLWTCRPDREVACLLARESDQVLVEQRAADAQRYR